MAEEILLTREGYEKIVAEHEELIAVKRKEVAERIKEALSYGDISENAEYDAAKEEQAEIETRITQIEKMLRNAEVIDEDELNTGKVNLGNTVVLWDKEFEEEITYTLVGPAEADPMQGKLSNESPLGMAMLGHSVGDIIENQAPDGVIEFKILDIK